MHMKAFEAERYEKEPSTAQRQPLRHAIDGHDLIAGVNHQRRAYAPVLRVAEVPPAVELMAMRSWLARRQSKRAHSIEARCQDSVKQLQAYGGQSHPAEL